MAFCAQVLLAALDYNIHSYRPQATTKSGHLIFKKRYSKRTKRWHPEPVRAEKTYDYIQFLMASILKARVDDEESAARVIFFFHQITQGIWPQPLACEKAQH